MNFFHPGVALVFVTLVASVTCAEDRIEVVDRPPIIGRNAHYFGNREPLAPSPLVKLPVGAISPRGWLRKQLELQAAGFHGHLGEISEFLKKQNNAWLSSTGQGERGWEEVPYWLKGFGDCAYLLGNQEQIQEAKVWIEAAMKSVQAGASREPGEGKGQIADMGVDDVKVPRALEDLGHFHDVRGELVVDGGVEAQGARRGRHQRGPRARIPAGKEGDLASLGHGHMLDGFLGV